MPLEFIIEKNDYYILSVTGDKPNGIMLGDVSLDGLAVDK